MAYFDNASTTYPKPNEVYSYMDLFYRTNGASMGRGSYEKSLTVNQLVSDTRLRIQKLLKCTAKQVIFTPTATLALNMIIQGLLSTGKKSVYTTPFEHNAVTRTLHHFESISDVTVAHLAVEEDFSYDLDKIRKQFESQPPEIVIINHASNVFGLVSPVEELSILAKEYGAIVIIDMAQTAGLVDCNIGLETIDFAVFAGHKTLYGPTGISGFVMKPNASLTSTLFGGTGFDSANQNMPDSLPERFEMGTMNSVGIAGLNAALRWIDSIGISQLKGIEEQNRNKLLSILSQYDFIHPVGISPSAAYIGIVSALFDNLSSDSLGSVFDRLGIALRTGLQCAPSAHKFLDTYPAGTVRFSIGYFTSQQDFEDLEKALTHIANNI